MGTNRALRITAVTTGAAAFLGLLLAAFLLGQRIADPEPAATLTAATVTTTSTTTTEPPATTTVPPPPPPTTAPPAPPPTISAADVALLREKARQAVTSAERAVRSYELVVQQLTDQVARDEAAVEEALFTQGPKSQEAADARQELGYDRKRLDNAQHDLNDARALLQRAQATAREVGA